MRTLVILALLSAGPPWWAPSPTPNNPPGTPAPIVTPNPHQTPQQPHQIWCLQQPTFSPGWWSCYFQGNENPLPGAIQ